MSASPWAGRRVLVTGHTGFKGAWLCALLRHHGAEVAGYALAPTDPSAYLAAGLDADVDGTIGDIRDGEALRRVLARFRPEVVLHLAAQALVRRSYADPVETFDVNVTGTAMVLHEATSADSVQVVLVVTSDKVYANDGSGGAFREGDRLGGGDPYSASKSAAELVAASWQHRRRVTGGAAVVVARAGNVIGGGDHAEDRLLPDLFRAIDAGRPLEVRHPDAVRPWQFVLEPLVGYLALAEAAWQGGPDVPPALNLGPGPEDCWPVHRVLDHVIAEVGEGSWRVSGGRADEPEAGLLRLDSSLATERLGWAPVLDLPAALAWTAAWHRTATAGGDLAALMTEQIARHRATSAP